MGSNAHQGAGSSSVCFAKHVSRLPEHFFFFRESLFLANDGCRKSGCRAFSVRMLESLHYCFDRRNLLGLSLVKLAGGRIEEKTQHVVGPTSCFRIVDLRFDV